VLSSVLALLQQRDTTPDKIKTAVTRATKVGACSNVGLWKRPAVEASWSLFARLVATQITPTLLAHAT
jgi:hypothetical protein